MIQKAAAVCKWWLAASSQRCTRSRIMSRTEFLVKHQITQVTQCPYSSDLVPCDFWLFPRLKSPLKGKRFQTITEIQENMMGQLMANATVWGSTWKGTEASLSYVQCCLYLVSSSIKVSFVWYMAGYFLDRPHMNSEVKITVLINNFLAVICAR